MCNHSRDPDCKPMWFLLSHIVAQTVFFTCYGAPVAVCFCRQSIALSLLLVFLWMSTFTFLTDAQPAGEVEPFINHFSVQLVQKNKHCRLFFFFMSGLFCIYTDWLQASRDVWLRSHIDWEVTRSLDSFDGCHPLSLPPCGPTEGNQFLVKWQQAVQHLIAPRVFIYHLWCHR